MIPELSHKTVVLITSSEHSDLAHRLELPEPEVPQNFVMTAEMIEAHKRKLKRFFIDEAENLPVELSAWFVNREVGDNSSTILHWYMVSLKAKVRHHLRVLA